MSRSSYLALACLGLLGCRFDRSGIPAEDVHSNQDSAETGLAFVDTAPQDDLDIALLSDGPAPVDTIPGCAWAYRRKLTFDAPKLPADLLDFPVLVVLDSTRIDYGKVKPGASDLRFTDTDGATVIPHEVERWGPTGRSFIWVKVPKIDQGSTADHIWLYYGHPAPPAGLPPTSVWGPGFDGVWHLGDDPSAPAPQIKDSTAFARHLATQGGIPSTATVPGRVGDGLELDGATQSLIGAVGSAPTVYTLEAWIKLDSVGNNAEHHIIEFYNMQFFVENNGKLEAGAGFNEFDTHGPTVLQIGTWYHVALVQRPTGWVIYRDGQIEVSGTQKTTPAPELFVGHAFAPGIPDSTYLDGILDEVRVSNVARPQMWIAAQRSSMMDGVLQYGPELSTGGAFCPQ